MTAPRNLLPRTTYLLSRWCVGGEWLLRGESDTNQLFGYWLARAAHDHDVEVHGYVQMGNYWLAVVTDAGRNIPDFVHDFDHGITVGMNAKLGRTESLWSSRRTGIVPLHTAESVLQKLAELITSPIAAGLVKSPRDWPGSISMGLCEDHTWYRPEPRSPSTEESTSQSARLKCTMPPALRDLAPEEAARLLKVRVAELTEEARKLVREARGGFLGADRVRTTPRSGPPDAPASVGERRPWATRLSESARRELKALMTVFLDAYDAALLRWRARDRWVEFPAGTYLMRVLHRAICAGSD